MVSVIIPAYNEESSIYSTINEVKNVLNSIDITQYEIIIIDDGSTDNTAKEAATTGIKIIINPHNMGYGFSLKRGITEAVYDTIIITDADSTYPFDAVADMLEQYNKGFDLVVGARTGKHYEESFLKVVLRKVLRKLVEFTAGRQIPDINSGLRVFSRDTIKPYLGRLCDTFSFTTSQTLAYMMTGKFVKYINIKYKKRQGTTKVRLLKDSVRTTQYIIEAAVYYNPLRIFMLFGILCILFSLFGIFLSLLLQIRGGYYLSIGGLLVALVIFCIGLLAVLLKQIMDKEK